MRLLMLSKPEADLELGGPPSEKEMAEMGAFIEDLAAKGVLLHTDGLLPSSKGFRVKLSNGEVTVTDGPFAETKEIIAGFAIIRVDTREAAIDLAERFLKIAGDGVSEVREMYDDPAYDGTQSAVASQPAA